MRQLSTMIFLLIIIASGIQAAEINVPGEQDLLLFYSNDVVGETDPCG